MNECLAFVLGGGGARGAMQVGALRALFEEGFSPDLLVGTSIGAANAVGLALWGLDLTGVDALEEAYSELAAANVLDPRLLRVALRALSGRPNHHASRRVAEFFISKGLSPHLRFEEIANVRLAMVGADLNSGQPVIYGQDPSQGVLEGLMASIALPPWFEPIKKDSRLIVDGGAVSNVPIEPALRMGATRIIALDLHSPPPEDGDGRVNGHLRKLAYAVAQRQTCLETELAEAYGVSVRRIALRCSPPVPIWEFSAYRDLIRIGYETASRELAAWAAGGAG